MTQMIETKGRWIKFGSFGTILLAALMFLSSSSILAADDDPVEFRFNPPDGIKLIENYKETTVITLDGKKRGTEVLEVKTEYVIRKMDDGFSVVALPISLNFTEDEMKLHGLNPIQDALRKSALEYKLDKQGKCIKVEGIEKTLCQMLGISNLDAECEADPELAEIIKELTDEEIDGWNSSFHDLFDTKHKPGDTWKKETEYPLPIGIPVTMPMNYKFTGMAERNGRQYAVIQMNGASNADALEIMVKQSLQESGIMNLPFMPQFDISSMEVFYKGELVIDPATMLTNTETYKATVKFRVSVAGEGVFPLVVDIWKQTTYEYPK